jgi:Homing endonuclease associated repeat/HNH endonuclease
MSGGAFQIKLIRRDIGDEEILVDIRRVATDVGTSSLTRLQYDERGQFGATTVIRRFKKWNLALNLAGLDIAHRQDLTNEELFENLAEVWTHLGRQPYGRDISDKATGSKFSTATYEKRFGSWNKALMAFSSYISGPAIEDALDMETDNQVVVRRSASRRTKRDINWRLRAKILIRDNCICKMCGASPAKNSHTVLHVDHILAWDLGGETLEENLQTLCEPCNIGKSNMDIRAIQKP